MNIFNKALITVLMPFLATTFTATAMDMKELVKHQANQPMEEPFEHDKYQLKPSYVIGRNGNYVSYNSHNTNADVPNVTKIAKEKALNEREKFIKTIEQYEAKNKEEEDIIQEQITQYKTKEANFLASATLFQQKLNDNAIDSLKKKLHEILEEPFNHHNYPITIKLAKDPLIGYLDPVAVAKLNKRFSVQENDPFVTITTEINKDAILKAANEQFNAEYEKHKQLAYKLDAIDPDEESKEAIRQGRLFFKRAVEMKASANNCSNNKLPSFFPVKYLQTDDLLRDNNNQFTHLDFKEDKELKTLMDDFKKKPNILFCELTPQLGEKIRNLSNEEMLDIETEENLIDQVNIIKTNFRDKKIVKRRDEDPADHQNYTREFLPNSNIVLYETNCHLHGENGYSEKRTRDEALANLTPNIFGFLNDRENGYKKRKINSELNA